jgi:hypothetical protein
VADGWQQEVEPLWRRIALHEAWGYLSAQMEEHSLSFRMGDGTRAVLREAVGRYSLGEVFAFCYSAAIYAAAQYQRGGGSRQQAANSVVSRIRGKVERAESEGWNVEPYARTASESYLTWAFYRRALQLSDSLTERLGAGVQLTG